jgi:hypothetical protein
MARRKRKASPDQKKMAARLVQARRTLLKWQGIIRLLDWDITVGFGRWHEIHEEAHAHAHFSVVRREAHILLRHPHDRAEPVWMGDNNDELTILHELMHLKLSGLDIPTREKLEEEAIAEQLARTLILLERG